MNAPVAIDYRALAHRDPWTIPVDEIDVSNPYLYQDDTAAGRSNRYAGIRTGIDLNPWMKFE